MQRLNAVASAGGLGKAGDEGLSDPACRQGHVCCWTPENNGGAAVFLYVPWVPENERYWEHVMVLKAQIFHS